MGNESDGVDEGSVLCIEGGHEMIARNLELYDTHEK